MQAYKRPESVLVVVHTKEGEVLLLERRTPSGYWQSVTGSLKDNETPHDAAIRELEEETGIKTADIEDCGITNRFEIVSEWKARYAPEVTHNTEHVFQLLLDQRVNITLNDHEHVAYAWLPKEEAVRKASSSTNREAIRTLVENK